MFVSIYTLMRRSDCACSDTVCVKNEVKRCVHMFVHWTLVRLKFLYLKFIYFQDTELNLVDFCKAKLSLPGLECLCYSGSQPLWFVASSRDFSTPVVLAQQ